MRMKTIQFACLLSLATLAPALTLSAKTAVSIHASDNTPAAVKATIARLYPTVKNVKYDKENGDYEASFSHDGKTMSVLLDGQGTVKETETDIVNKNCHRQRPQSIHLPVSEIDDFQYTKNQGKADSDERIDCAHHESVYD